MIRSIKYFAAALALLLVAGTTAAAPKAELWERWTAHDAASTQSIDHSAWDGILKQFIERQASGVNHFAYDRFDNPARDRLDRYIKALSETPISEFNRDQQQAFWINLYNALTIQVVANHYPVESIRDISSGFFSSGPWGKDLIEVESETLTLDDIEHRILRPIWQDPRIHYAVNCASIGCPNLLTEAFTAKNTDRLMELAAVEFINHPRGANVVDGELQVSSIYDWFKQDFGGNDAGVIAHLRQYARDPLKSRLEGITEIDNDSYDWSLNSAETTRKTGTSRRSGS